MQISNSIQSIELRAEEQHLFRVDNGHLETINVLKRTPNAIYD